MKQNANYIKKTLHVNLKSSSQEIVQTLSLYRNKLKLMIGKHLIILNRKIVQNI